MVEYSAAMQPLTVILIATVVFCSVSNSHAQSLAEDDFTKVSGNWEPDGMGKVGKHTLKNGRLEFSTKGKFTNNDSAYRSWNKDVLLYDESWSVQVDVFVGNFQLGKKPYAGSALLVHGPAKTMNSFIRLQLRRGDRGFRAFNADGYVENHIRMGSKMVPTTSKTATIRIQFDAKMKTLTASYDEDGQGPNQLFVPFYTVDIGKGANRWNMNKSDAFSFEIVSQSTNTAISSGDMYFDNVIATKVAP